MQNMAFIRLSAKFWGYCLSTILCVVLPSKNIKVQLSADKGINPAEEFLSATKEGFYALKASMRAAVPMIFMTL